MDKKPEKLVPEVRFKGFTDDWEQRKLGDVVNFFSGLTYHPSDVKNKGYFVIRSSNIQNNQIVSADDIFVNKDIINVPNVKQGDIIVVVRNGSRKLIGKHAQVLTDMPNTVIGAFMTGVRSKSNFYINALLDSDQFQKEIYKNLGATINQITIGEFRKMRFIITSGNEAQTIGEFFKKIDTLITLQQRKLKQLNLLQRYIKEKTLPSQKELPKLRFLTTPYNTYKFSELFKKSTKKNDGQILQNHVISVASMRWGKLPKSSSEAYMKTYFIFNKGDIAYEGNRSKSYSFGRFVANDLGNGIVSHVFSVFNSKINFNLEFLKNYINSEQVMRDPLRMSTSRTTMMTNLVLKDIAKQTLMIPSKDEQDLLGSLYKITQSMIELNEKQQQELIYLKKYLLQKLFI